MMYSMKKDVKKEILTEVEKMISVYTQECHKDKKIGVNSIILGKLMDLKILMKVS